MTNILPKEEFNELKSREMKEHLIDVLDTNPDKYGLKTKSEYTSFYEKIFPLLQGGESITDEISKKFSYEIKNPDSREIKTGVLKYKNVGNGNYILKRSTDGSSGYDLYLDRCITDDESGNLKGNSLVLEPGEMKLYGTGIAVEFPEGFYGQVVPRSGLATEKCMVMLANNTGIIDNDYRGEIMLKFINVGNFTAYGPLFGKRVAQLILHRCEIADTLDVHDLEETQRGDGGFGSTGEE